MQAHRFACSAKRLLLTMSQDSAAVPSTQLELEQVQDSGLCCSSQPALDDIPDLMPCDSPPAHFDFEEEDDDPPSHSCTPSLDLMELAEMSNPQLAPTPPQQQAWAQYAGCPFDASSPIEAQLSGFVIADRFLLKRILGAGSFGVTYKALDTQNGNAEVRAGCCRLPPFASVLCCVLCWCAAKAQHTHPACAGCLACQVLVVCF